MPDIDPIERFRTAFERARREGVTMPEAMALATVGPEGAPSVRMVLLKAVDDRGFVFYTNLESRKGRELRAHPVAALCFHWQPVEVQVRVEGPVTPVDPAEADAYFASRPRGSQLGAWASRQSQTLAGRDDLLRAVHEVDQRYAGGAVPRPPFWSGFRVVPARVEFWEGRPDRLHERVEYTRGPEGWLARMLQP